MQQAAGAALGIKMTAYNVMRARIGAHGKAAVKGYGQAGLPAAIEQQFSAETPGQGVPHPVIAVRHFHNRCPADSIGSGSASGSAVLLFKAGVPAGASVALASAEGGIQPFTAGRYHQPQTDY